MVSRLLLAAALFIALQVPARGDGPLLGKPVFKRPLLLDVDTGIEEPGEVAKRWIEKAIVAAKNGPVLPGGMPLLHGPRLFYSSYSDVRCVAGLPIKHMLGEEPQGSICWKSVGREGSLVGMLDSEHAFATGLRTTASNLLAVHFNQNQSWPVLENSLLGTLSFDGDRIMALDDLAIPVPPSTLEPLAWREPRIWDIRQRILANDLYAYDRRTGALQWHCFEPNSHFLSTPLSVGEKLFVLNEKHSGPKGQAELRLMLLEPKKWKPVLRKMPGEPLTSLGAVPEAMRFTHDIRRRMQAAPMGHDDGVLYCASLAGKVFGIDLEGKRIRWSYEYRKASVNKEVVKGGIVGEKLEVPQREWRVAGLFVTKGRIVFAAPDDAFVHCLDRKDGALLWKAKRKEALYLAGVFGDVILVVGPTKCRALRVADGKEQWSLKTGVPGGRGAAEGSRYCLPLLKGKSGGPEICILDVARGQIETSLRMPRGEIPGNLVLHDDLLLSQTVMHIAAYERPVIGKEKRAK